MHPAGHLLWNWQWNNCCCAHRKCCMGVGEAGGEEMARVATVAGGPAWAAGGWVVGAQEVAGWEAGGEGEKGEACSR